MPGEKVVVGMGITDNSLAGNEIKEASADFAFEDDSELPLTVEDGDKTATKPRRRPRRNREPEAETADCGACGAVIPADAKKNVLPAVQNSNDGCLSALIGFVIACARI